MKRDDDERLERLDEYVRGGGSDPDAFEDELFARALDGDARELALFDGIVASVKDLVARGSFDGWVLAPEAERLRARYGSRAAFVAIGPEAAQRVVVPPDAELVISRVALDLRGVSRLDLEIRLAGVGPVKTMPAIPFDPEEGAIYGVCEGDLARISALPGVTSLFWSIEGGTRRLVRELVTDTVVGPADRTLPQ